MGKVKRASITIIEDKEEYSITVRDDISLEKLLWKLDGLVVSFMGWKPKGTLKYVEEEGSQK